MTLEGPRVMDKIFQGINFDTDGSTGALINITGSGWQPLGAAFMAVQRSYFDLSGYNRKKLTTFIQGVEIQEAGTLASTDTITQVMELITTEYLSDAELSAVFGAAVTSAPGFPSSTVNQEQIIYGRRRVYTNYSTQLAATIPLLHSTQRWGTCSATTADKLHITRVAMTNSINKTINIPDVNVVLAAVIVEEKELPFLMRQKRSYELATGS